MRRSVPRHGPARRLKRGENLPAETMAHARLQCGAQTLEEKARGDHEHAAARHLRHDQTGAQASDRARWPQAFALKHGGRVGVSQHEERHEPAGNRDSGTRSGGRDDAEAIRSERKMPGILFEEERRNNVRRPYGQQHAARAAGHRDENAVRQQLPGELTARRAERDANGCLVRTGGRTRKQERGDVGARDEEHRASRDAQQPGDARHAARGFGRHAGVRKHGDRVGAGPSRVDGGLRPIDRHTRAQPPEHPERPAGAIEPWTEWLPQRHPDVDGTAKGTDPRANPARRWPHECQRRRCESGRRECRPSPHTRSATLDG